MALTNSIDQYGGITKTFHWLTALLILTVIPLGVVAYNLPYDTAEQLARKAWLFSLHKTVGVTIFFVAIARILWALTQPKPDPVATQAPALEFLAKLAHWTLYASLILVPLTGWIHHAATTGFAPIWWPFGQSLPFVPKDNLVAERFGLLHKFFERVLVVSLLLHIAGALKHHVVDKDATLRRMWFGQTRAAGPSTHGNAALPPLAALAIFAAVGTAAAVQPIDDGPAVPTLEAVASDWTVQDGEVGLTVTQLGSQVGGSFSDWTSAIEFDPDADGPVKGNVTTTINIASLTLGSVTDQALGPDYFSATDFPTAVFTGDLIEGPNGYEAQGALQIRDVTQPLTFPFDLTIEEDVATMSANLTLNRLDFNIGQSMNDESSLGFAVDVSLTLTATRGE